MRIVRWFLLIAAILMTTTVISGWSAFGAHRFGPSIGSTPSAMLRASRIAASPQSRDGRFVNAAPMHDDYGAVFRGLLRRSPRMVPDVPLPVQTDVLTTTDGQPTADTTALRITWYGHSSMRLDMGGLRVLVDPMWGNRPSPLSWLGPQRWYAPPAALEEIAPIDVVLISHDHYDHLDQGTIVAIATNPANARTRFLVPLGVGAHLEHWGVEPERISEFDWWESQQVGSVTFTCTPARHASGRTLLDRDATLWAGWALATATQRVFYSGDTGMMPAFRDIGERLGPFDITLMQTGAYDTAWPDWHLSPEQAVDAHRQVRGDMLLPVHWGLFNLAYHAWDDPIIRLTAAADAHGVQLTTPRPGETFTLGVGGTHPAPSTAWWTTP